MLKSGQVARVPVLGAALLLSACMTSEAPPEVPRTSVQAAIAEVSSRPNSFPNYPRANTTYLSFNKFHGFQVNYIAPGGLAWLWFPGNSKVVPEEWRLDSVNGTKAICFRHPSNSRNPATSRRGGAFQCQPLELSQKAIVARLNGDAFKLASGNVPYRLSRCEAPEAFHFDRLRIRC